MLLIIEHILDLRKTEEVALSMQGSGSPERPGPSVYVPGVDAKELRVAKLEDLLRDSPFELVWGQVSVSVQAVPMGLEKWSRGDMLTDGEEKRQDEHALVDTHDTSFEEDVDQDDSVDEFFEEGSLCQF